MNKHIILSYVYEESFAMVKILSLKLGSTKIFVVLVENCNQE